MNSLKDVSNALKSATRMGGDKDSPEGVRYIMLSDSISSRMAAIIDRCIDDEEFLNDFEAARVLRVSNKMLNLMATRGLIPFYRIPASKDTSDNRRFKKSELIMALEFRDAKPI
jgi:hypothetical protein